MTKWEWSVVVALCRMVLRMAWGRHYDDDFQKNRNIIVQAINRKEGDEC